MLGKGLLRVSTSPPKPRMASHGVSQTLSAHACSKNLDFLITTEGRLARAPTPTQPPCFASLDAMVDALEKLQLHALEAHAPEGN
jgi:hypothetical protein